MWIIWILGRSHYLPTRFLHLLYMSFGLRSIGNSFKNSRHSSVDGNLQVRICFTKNSLIISFFVKTFLLRGLVLTLETACILSSISIRALCSSSTTFFFLGCRLSAHLALSSQFETDCLLSSVSVPVSSSTAFLFLVHLTAPSSPSFRTSHLSLAIPLLH